KLVRVTLKNGTVRIGKVIFDGDDQITIKLPAALMTYQRADIEALEDVEPLRKTYEEKVAAAKTADDMYNIGLWAEEKKFEQAFKKGELWEKAVALDKNHEGAHKKLGHVKRMNGRGEAQWVDKKTAAEWDKLGA